VDEANPDLRQNRWYEWFLTLFFTKIFGLSGFFNPDLRQFRIKSALFISRNPDFSVLTRCCVLKCTDWSSLGKIRQLSTQHKRDHERTFRIMITTAATERNIRLIVGTSITSHTGIAYHIEYHAAVPRFQSIDRCWVCPRVYCIGTTSGGHCHYLPNRTVYGPVVEISASVKNPRFLRSQVILNYCMNLRLFITAWNRQLSVWYTIVHSSINSFCFSKSF